MVQSSIYARTVPGSSSARAGDALASAAWISCKRRATFFSASCIAEQKRRGASGSPWRQPVWLEPTQIPWESKRSEGPPYAHLNHGRISGQ
eukprot:scaffold1636_cov165-Ochromonas_danica.AAC.2